MFYQIRYQTGEMENIINEMKNGNIPCMDVDDMQEFEWFVNELSKNGIFRVEGFPYDKNARNRVAEPEFEFRVAFYTQSVSSKEMDKNNLMFIDFYFEPDFEETYDSIGEM